MLFCNHCGNERDPKYSLAPISALLGLVLLGFAALTFLAVVTAADPLPPMRVTLFFLVIGGLCVALSYANRRLFCDSCGSSDLLPPDSPKAMEFKNRTRAFEHVVENRIPPPAPIAAPPSGESKRVRFRP